MSLESPFLKGKADEVSSLQRLLNEPWLTSQLVSVAEEALHTLAQVSLRIIPFMLHLEFRPRLRRSSPLSSRCCPCPEHFPFPSWICCLQLSVFLGSAQKCPPLRSHLWLSKCRSVAFTMRSHGTLYFFLMLHYNCVFTCLLH